MLLVEPSHLPGELPNLFHEQSPKHQQLLDDLLGRQGSLFSPLFSLHGPGMHPAIVMGRLAVTPCPQRGQTVRFGRNTLAFPQHGPQSSKRPIECSVQNQEICRPRGVAEHLQGECLRAILVVVETPLATLVAGMKWLLGAYTSRFNQRHRLLGHLFSGRYKALIADGSWSGYLRRVCDYVHWNPVRSR
jgi:hypothetical protein